LKLPMKNNLLHILLFALLLGASSASRADVVYIKGGGKLEGRIVEQTESSVEVDIGAGTLTFPMSSVERVEKGRSPLDDYDERVQGLAENDRDGWLELARWASGVGLGTQSLRAYEHVLTLDPNNPEANKALGRVQVDGRWMTGDEAYRARGYVQFEGQWMTPAEQESILRTREADQAAAQARAQSDEAQAREAEARAREAEAQAQQTTYAAPLYWRSWGPGPSNWPSNPLDRPQQPRTGRTQRQP
ncbi:MAG: hypothetical protein WBG05_16625, partial [Thermoanaerobaculia bacterium]